jgi:alpha-D-ribose 1-methylphosphonate 5-triphosphate synthase subunit PhnH
MIGLQTTPAPGFADPVFDAQTTFRAVLGAMARPGSRANVGVEIAPPAPLSPAAAAVALTLFDRDTPVWLDQAAAVETVESFLVFHCGSPRTDEPADAAFALIADAANMPPLQRFGPGTDAYPDSSTTLVIELPSLDGGREVGLTGPGIDGQTVMAPSGLPKSFWDWMTLNRSMFPLGVDVILTCGREVACLPRTTRIGGSPCT